MDLYRRAADFMPEPGRVFIPLNRIFICPLRRCGVAWNNYQCRRSGVTSNESAPEPKTVAVDMTVRGLVAGGGLAGLSEVPVELLIAEAGEMKQLAFREVLQTVISPAATRFAAAACVGGSLGSLAGYLFGRSHAKALQRNKNAERGGRE
jgi:hypothetical protein